jgi:hypothetical protein
MATKKAKQLLHETVQSNVNSNQKSNVPTPHPQEVIDAVTVLITAGLLAWFDETVAQARRYVLSAGA